MIIEDCIDIKDTAINLEPIVKEYAKIFNYTIDKKDNIFQLKSGSIFSINHNKVNHILHIKQSENKVLFTIKALVFPWTKNKIKRLLSFRMIQVIDFIKVKTAGGNIDNFSTLYTIKPFSLISNEQPFTSLIFSSSWIILSIILSMIITFAVVTLSGLIIMNSTINEIIKRTFLIEYLGETPLPSITEALSIDFGFKICSAILFSIPIAFFISLCLSLFLALTEIFVTISKLTIWAIVFFILLLLISFLPLMPPISVIGFSLIIPLSAYIGYSVIWGLKREKRRGITKPKRITPKTITAIALIFILFLAIFFDIKTGDNLTRDLALFRDRVLLKSEFGKAFTNFYYRYTLYAAEPIKPLVGNGYDIEKQQKVALLFTKNNVAKNVFISKNFYIDYVTDVEQIIKKINPVYFDDYDVYVVDESSLVAETLIQKIGHHFRLILLKPTSTSDEIDSRLQDISMKTFKGKNIRDLIKAGFGAIFYIGPILILAVTLIFFACLIIIIYKKLSKFIAYFFITILLLSLIILFVINEPTKATIEEIRDINVKEATSIDKLISYLNNTSPDIRYEAIYQIYWYLHYNRNNKCLEPLLSALNDKDVRVRIWACGALGLLKDKIAIPKLMDALSDKEVLVRYRAVEALGQIGSKEVIASLKKAMQNDWWYVGWYCLMALRNLETPR